MLSTTLPLNNICEKNHYKKYSVHLHIFFYLEQHIPSHSLSRIFMKNYIIHICICIVFHTLTYYVYYHILVVVKQEKKKSVETKNVEDTASQDDGPKKKK